jgi:hypothetical protein
MVSLQAALHRVKDDIPQILCQRSIEEACLRHGHAWRAGPLTPAATIQFFVRQIIEKNVSGAEVVRLAGGRFTEAAWCQARQRLPLAVLRDLADQVRDRVRQCNHHEEAMEWKNHKVYVVDGSNVSMPDTPDLWNHFGLVPGQKPGCGFPVAHWLAVFDLHTGVLVYDEASAYTTSDLQHTPAAQEVLGSGAILLGDDAFGSYAQFSLLLQRNLNGVFPSHHARIVDFTPGRPGGADAAKGQPRSRWIRSLGKEDQVVEMYKPSQRPKWLTPDQYDALPHSIQVREIRRTIRRKGFRPVERTVVTTLLDPRQYPADEIVALRGLRWDVETDIRHLKTTMNMDVLRCQTAQGVLKELAVFIIVYNLVRAVMLESARMQKVSPIRLSFADALAWVCHAEPGHQWPKLKVVPLRRGRTEPRAVKRRPKPFDLMNRPRDEMRKHCLTLHKRR